MNQIKRFVTEEKGQGMTEYGLILGLVALAAVGIMATMGDEIKGKFEDVIKDLRTPTKEEPTA